MEMVSVLQGPGLSEAVGFYHVPRQTAKSIHLRSQSMPEAVYLQHQQAMKQATQPPPPQFKPARMRHPSGTQSGSNGIQMVSLRRSHTNVADFSRRRPPQTRYWNEGCELPSYGPMYLARSRSNIAALGLNPEAVYRPNGLPKTSINRASSFYHHRDHRPMQTARSLGFLAASNLSHSRSSITERPGAFSQSCKDLSQPLHVDCSVEYDLGNQPKIPKDSAPLLIIHPAYAQDTGLTETASNSRFHPYNSSSTSMISPGTDFKSKGSSSGHGTSLASSSLSSTSSGSRLPPGQRYPVSKIARHSSFLITSPPRMVALDNSQILMQKGGTPINRQNGGHHRSLLHLSMPDIQAKVEAKPKLEQVQRWNLHNKKAQHRHHLPQKQNLSHAKLGEVVNRKLSASSTASSSHCDSGFATPTTSFLDDAVENASTRSSSQNSLSKLRSSMSGKKKIILLN